MGSLVEAAEHIEKQALVVAGFERSRVLFAGLADGGQRVFVVALAALNFADVDEGLSVFRIRFGQKLELLQGLVELIVAEQGLASTSRVCASPGSMSAARW